MLQYLEDFVVQEKAEFLKQSLDEFMEESLKAFLQDSLENYDILIMDSLKQYVEEIQGESWADLLMKSL